MGESFYPAISGDGRHVAFASAAPNLVVGDGNASHDVFVHDLGTGATTLVSKSRDGVPGAGSSFGPSMSADARYVAFPSAAPNLVAATPCPPPMYSSTTAHSDASTLLGSCPATPTTTKTSSSTTARVAPPPG